jgi:hypothetical protein
MTNVFSEGAVTITLAPGPIDMGPGIIFLPSYRRMGQRELRLPRTQVPPLSFFVCWSSTTAHADTEVHRHGPRRLARHARG